MTDKVSPATEILHAHGVRLEPGLAPFDTIIREGEIVGLAGLEGHGQQRFLQALCGLFEPAEGRVQAIKKDGQTIEITNLHKAAKAGIAYLPRERKTEGIMPVLSVLDNFSMATLSQDSWFGILNRRTQHKKLDHFRERLSMVFASPKAPITSLSGGNQQKVLLARWMASSPRVMLLNDPTRGVDVATKATLYEVFRDTARDEGTAIVLLSTEIEEFLLLCDRTLVFRDGALFATLARNETTRAKILAAMFGRTNGD